MVRRILVVLSLLLFLFLLAGCFPGGGTNSPEEPAGFFKGIWHGWIAPISLIAGLFDHTIRLYELHNTGWWYDLGFYVAVISGFGGISLFRRKKSDGD
jgi:hypothetical protein